MKIDCEFKKLFQKLEEGDRINSIIAYIIRPYECKFIEHNDGKGQEVVVKWECMLQIDLYLIRLRFIFIKNAHSWKNKTIK